MSIESVRAFFAEKAPEITVIESEVSSATVTLAAEAYGVEPGRIVVAVLAHEAGIQPAGGIRIRRVTIVEQRTDHKRPRSIKRPPRIRLCRAAGAAP